MQKYNFKIRSISIYFETDALKREEHGSKVVTKRVVKVRVNVTKNTRGTFSLEQILAYQKELSEKEKRRATNIENVLLKSLKETEVSVVTSELSKTIMKE